MSITPNNFKKKQQFESILSSFFEHQPHVINFKLKLYLNQELRKFE